MKTNIVIDISPPILYLVIRVMGQNTVSQSNYRCNDEVWMMKCIFGMEINIEVFYKLILSFWVCVTRHSQSTQNKFAYLCNISSKAWEMKLIFYLQINTSFLQVNSIILGVLSQACPKYPEQHVYNIFAMSKKKCEGWSWFFACW